jgi:hypothetical protein
MCPRLLAQVRKQLFSDVRIRERDVQTDPIGLQANSIKRVPIERNGQLVGIVSRANLVQIVAVRAHAAVSPA